MRVMNGLPKKCQKPVKTLACACVKTKAIENFRIGYNFPQMWHSNNCLSIVKRKKLRKTAQFTFQLQPKRSGSSHTSEGN